MLLRQLLPSMVVGCALVGAAAILSRAGPLDPPAGPVSSSYKTLSEVEPRIAINSVNTPGDADSTYKIVSQGSYYLTDNLIGESAKMGIEIAVASVTIDLSGFTLAGVPGSLDAISVSLASSHGMTIENGSIRDWGGDGVDLAVARNSIVRGVRVINCTGTGIVVSNRSLVRDCVSHANLTRGIQTGLGTEVVDSTASNNSAEGIVVNHYSVVSRCAATANLGHGVSLGYSCATLDCQASQNSGDGIHATNNAAHISRCAATINAGDGILVIADSDVRDNKCDGDLNGVHATGIDNRIEGNSLTDCVAAGLLVDLDGNLIIRNSASGSVTQYSVAAGNAVGPIVTAATIAVSSNPHANYEY
jgi:hypothetical protein